MKNKIDFVIPWVDGSDVEWLEEKKRFCKNNNDEKNAENRYRDMGILKYWFRSVEKYTPWVNKIYFITWGHIPDWLNTESDKIVVINHKDYIPKEYLPTFSSHVIELNIHRIKELSEHFVYFNDDMFITDYMDENDFFYNGVPKEYAILNPISPTSEFEHIVVNNMRIINKHFDKNTILTRDKRKWLNIKYGKDNIRTIFLKRWDCFCGLKESHLPNAYLKSTFDEVWQEENDLLKQTSSHKFRAIDDVNQWLIKYWQIMQGRFEPRSPKIGKRFDLTNNNEDVIMAIKKNTYKMICINDGNMNYNFDEALQKIKDCFESVLPEKSIYEK